MPNFDEIPQSTAEIKLYFRFRNTDGRHIGILFPVSISA